jgi:hypothetical protein
MLETCNFAPLNIESMETVPEREVIVFYSRDIKAIYPKLNQYFGFEYSDISVELQSSWDYSAEYSEPYFKTGNINHLPDDFNIPFISERWGIMEFIEKYAFTNNNPYVADLIGLLVFLTKNWRNSFYGIPETNEMYYGFVEPDRRKLYEFLLDNFKEYNFDNLPKAQITILYGQNSQITIDNHENWLYHFLKKELHKRLTFDGKFEYERITKADRPSHAPQFHNFIVYNLYLLLMDVVGSDKEYSAEFCKFIIDFCKLCDIELIGRQSEVLGIKDLIKGAKKQYGNNPIPFSLIR